MSLLQKSRVLTHLFKWSQGLRTDKAGYSDGAARSTRVQKSKGLEARRVHSLEVSNVALTNGYLESQLIQLIQRLERDSHQ